jgi:disulfide bond formation protein DsbB
MPAPMNSVSLASHRQWTWIFSAWLIAVAATLGSLFFSEVMDLAPCVLCWYQRIFMFPLAVILTVAFFPFDLGHVKYSLAFAFGGWCVALYHCLLYAGLVLESIQPCSLGVSCADTASQQIEGVPIPLMSLIAFSIIIALLIAARKGIRK